MEAWLVSLLFVSLLQLSVAFLPAPGSFKKGLAVSWQDYRCGDFEVLRGGHWWHDYSAGTHNYTADCQTKLPIKYTPTVWGWNLDGRSNDHHFGSNTVVLGFNEPNLQDQSHLSYVEAARAWPEVQRQAGSRKLVSPAVAAGTDIEGDPIAWYTGFFNECKDCRFNYIGVHYYGCDDEQLGTYLDDLWHRFNHKLWVSAFSCTEGTASQRHTFLFKAIKQLEIRPHVHRYAWYPTRSADPKFSPGNILLPNASKLTDLGLAYMHFQTFDFLGNNVVD